VIQPGVEYTYYGLTSGRRTGSYFAEMAYRHTGTELWRMSLAGTNRVVYTTACDGRCELVRQAFADVLGRAPNVDEHRLAHDSPLGDAQLRAYLCGLPDRKAAACGGSTAVSPLRSLFSYLPAVVRPAGR
jgi:hypothetical protein